MAARPPRSGRLHTAMDRVHTDIMGDPRPPLLPANRTNRRPGRINLKAVSEVLAERGMDPTEELINILDAVTDKGQPVLDADVRARILNELLQYVQPKLKSIEVKAKVVATSFDINDEQAKKIAEEFLKLEGIGE